MVGADVGREDGVVLLADLEDALARLDVPDDGEARLAAPAAAGQEQAAVAAELQDVDRPLGEGEDADQAVVRSSGRAGPACARRPRRGAPRGWRPWRRSRWAWALTTTGSVGRFSGMAGGPAGLPIAERVELELELRLRLDRGHAPRGLGCPAFDPLP